MKTFFQIRKELNEGYESNKIRQAAVQRLSHGTGTEHSGHDGMASYHSSMADKHKGTEAGKHHQRAADHHMRALSATKKGNLKSGLTHAKNAVDAAKAAHNSGDNRHSKAGMLDSMKLHRDHNSDVNTQARAQKRDDEYSAKNKPKRSDRPIARAIGKTKSKIKKVLKMGEEVEQVDEISNKTLDSYMKKAGDQYQKSKDYLDGPKFPVQRQNPAAVKRHTARLKRRHKGMGSVYKRDDARRNPDGSHAAKYIHKPSMGDRITTGTAKGSAFGGDTLRNKPSSALPKTYRNPNRK